MAFTSRRARKMLQCGETDTENYKVQLWRIQKMRHGIANN